MYAHMNKVLPMLAAALLLAGCAQHYDMTLTNGVRVTNVTKPILNTESGTYNYKDVAGTERHVSQSRVLEIKPHSRHNDVVSANGH
jgi:uncharacterized lipoprotein YajG